MIIRVPDEAWRRDDRFAENLRCVGALDGTVEAGDGITVETRCCCARSTEILLVEGRLEVTDRVTDQGRRRRARCAESLLGEGMLEVPNRVGDEAHHAGQQGPLLLLYPLNLFLGPRR